MFRHSYLQRRFLLALVATLALADLVLAGPLGRGGRVGNLGVDSGAFRGPYRGGYDRRGDGGLSLDGGYDFGPSYYYTPPPPPPLDEQQRSYHPPQPPQQASATIELYVPPDAEVWFQGRKTTQTGTLRRFVTTPMPFGVDYAYEMRVRWTDANGEAHDQARQVVVQAGRQFILNLQEAPSKK